MYEYWRDEASLRLFEQSHNPLKSSSEESLQTALFLCYNNLHEDYFFHIFGIVFKQMLCNMPKVLILVCNC